MNGMELDFFDTPTKSEWKKQMSNNAHLDTTNVINQTIQVVSVDEIRNEERQRISDRLRDQAADLIADGHMASAELVLLGKLIDWLEEEQK